MSEKLHQKGQKFIGTYSVRLSLISEPSAKSTSASFSSKASPPLLHSGVPNWLVFFSSSSAPPRLWFFFGVDFGVGLGVDLGVDFGVPFLGS